MGIGLTQEEYQAEYDEHEREKDELRTQLAEAHQRIRELEKLDNLRVSAVLLTVDDETASRIANKHIQLAARAGADK